MVLKENTMIDNDGFRANVGIILCNRDQKLFWGHRIGQKNSWQFPQGGIDADESPEEAMYRELQEETGLEPEHVTVLGRTEHWLKYRLPRQFLRRREPNKRLCIGQKQIWYLLRLETDESKLQLDASDSPEFDGWKWVEYWTPINRVIHFKRNVYDKALTELAPLLFGDDPPPREFSPPRRKRRRTRSLYHINNRK